MDSQPCRTALEDLARLDVGEVFFSAPLSRYCTWRVGGPADLLIEPSSVEQIERTLAFTAQRAIPLVVIGQGSNLLFSDSGVRGVVLRLGPRFSCLAIDGTRIVAEGGVWVPGLVRAAQRHGLAGLEHMIGIPGTIGGLVLMNGGSRRRGVGENVKRVWVVAKDGHSHELTAEECRFGYRRSALQGSGCVVVRVELECPSGNPQDIRRAMLEDLRERRAKFPLKLPNCGSVFLSSAEMHASVGPPGKIIEEAGLKGRRVGDAQVSPRHANFIVNLGNATSAEILTLMAEIRKVIRQRIAFDLECEVRYVTPQGEVVPAHLMCE